ncbi:hypothetical protein ACQR0Z_10490 [Bradyrhizobium sp. HKCCYLS3077]|uniref:hypothetical protein n=1 Tax=Bradyrhizobium sp. HKCCYLS3077 TaxID=3420761 RepID=UPI003EBAC661
MREELAPSYSPFDIVMIPQRMRSENLDGMRSSQIKTCRKQGFFAVFGDAMMPIPLTPANHILKAPNVQNPGSFVVSRVSPE